MRLYHLAGAAATGLCLAACGNSVGNGAADANAANATQAGNTGAAATAGNAGNGSAAAFCQFTRDQVRNFHASINQMPPNPGNRPLVVTGEAQVGDPHYRAQLSDPQVSGNVLRLWLTWAEAGPGPAPADGWHALRYERANPGAITRVVIWCDHDNDLLTLPVERPQ